MKGKFENFGTEAIQIPVDSIPSNTQPEEPINGIYDTDDKTIDTGPATAELSKKSDKSKSGKIAAFVNVRISFSQRDYTSLILLALAESEKTGSRITVNSLLQKHAIKFIKKGASNV